ncbi:DnaJ domain-containing protein [Gudongella oleilytica]|uniref:J domain-containing protein n=1 Tax=Gudongella oleilytica TaxID=1582259 RepID=UPI002A36661A|nr:DnaJ domain-containing protein [Gudongella oleilytica]MDY0256104.1 DnaJ domain-containing protein [Gudongella oleilytica]
MRIIKKITGKVIYAFGQFLSAIFDLFIWIAGTAVGLVAGIARAAAALIGMGGCLLIFLLSTPAGLLLLLNPVTLMAIVFFIVFPILGYKFISFLKYLKYIVTEYLFDLGSYLMDGKGQHKSFSEYGHKYQRMEEERISRERAERQQQQQKEWEERFRQWQSYQQQSQQQGGYYRQQPYSNPMTEFRSRYEKACSTLGVGTDTDKYQVKLAYRKKAKEYHPDINHSPDATKRFQEINEAYEFLSDENIERYKQMRN